MSFSVSADSYDRYMGRYSRLLAPLFAHFAQVKPGWQVPDVGCGPGPLTSELARHNGTRSVLIHSTKLSKLRVAAAMDHIVKGPRGTDTSSEGRDTCSEDR